MSLALSDVKRSQPGPARTQRRAGCLYAGRSSTASSRWSSRCKAVDTTGVEPLAHPISHDPGFALRLRDDVVTEPNRRDDYQKPAPASPGRPVPGAQGHRISHTHRTRQRMHTKTIKEIVGAAARASRYRAQNSTRHFLGPHGSGQRTTTPSCTSTRSCRWRRPPPPTRAWPQARPAADRRADRPQGYLRHPRLAHDCRLEDAGQLSSARSTPPWSTASTRPAWSRSARSIATNSRWARPTRTRPSAR